MEVDLENNEFVCSSCQGREDIIGGQTSHKNWITMEEEKCCCCGEKDYEKLNQVECEYDCLHYVCDRCLSIRK